MAQQKTWSEIEKTPHGEKNNYEVYFPHDFIQFYPSGDQPNKDGDFELEVKKLCHVAHNKQAEQIKNHDDGHYHFKTHKKFGKPHIKDRVTAENNKAYHSYRCTLNDGEIPDERTRCYQLILGTDQLLHGYFSWWGLAIDQQSRDNLPDFTVSPVNLPGYLKDTPQSFYGRNAFVSSFRHLLESYRTSRQCHQDHNIHLRMGGTLRYKREIGYVVIVCTSDDREALDNYAPITHDNIFNPNGLVGQTEDGMVVNMDATPHFTTRFINTSTSYETLNFAFYFPENNDLMCHGEALEEVVVDHECPCLHKQPIRCFYNQPSGKYNYYEKCPDKVTQKDRDQHALITAIGSGNN